MSTTHSNYFGFERLDVYVMSVAINQEVAAMAWPTGRSHLKDQAIRAVDSLVLNIAEGFSRGHKTGAGRNHFRIAHGSAGEVFAVFDILQSSPDTRSKLQRVGSMLHRLASA